MAAKDETCISPEAFDLVKEECEGTLVHELTHGYYQTAHVKSKTEEDKKVERLNRMQSHREDKARGYRMVTRDQFKEWREEQRTKEDIATDTGLSLLHMQRHNDISIENMAALYPVVETMKSFIPGKPPPPPPVVYGGNHNRCGGLANRIERIAPLTSRLVFWIARLALAMQAPSSSGWPTDKMLIRTGAI